MRFARPVSFAFVGLAALAGTESILAAQVQYYDSFKIVYYDQTSDGAPIDSSIAGHFFGLGLSDPADADTMIVTYPGPSSPWNVPKVTAFQFSAFTGYVADEAALEVAFPAGAYSYAIDNGTLGPQTGILTMPFPVYCDDIPHFSGDTYTRLQGMDPAQDFIADINSFFPDAGVDEALIFVIVYQSCGGPDLLGLAPLPNTATSFTIPANTLEPAHQYTIAMYYSSRVVVPGAGFGGSATSNAAFDRVTLATFNTTYNGCLADIDGFPGVDLGDFFAFFGAYDLGDPLADLDGCGGVDLNDFFLFFGAYDLGC